MVPLCSLRFLAHSRSLKRVRTHFCRAGTPCTKSASLLRRLGMLFVWLLGLWWGGTVQAQWVYPVAPFWPSQYHAGTQNWQVIPTAQGWLYAANNYGLLEYDGANWFCYALPNRTPVRAITQGKNGEIFAGGTNDFGVFKGNSQGEMAFESWVEAVPEAFRPFGEVWAMEVLDSCLYVQTRNSIFALSLATRTCTVYDLHTHIFGLTCFENQIFAASEMGLLCLSSGRWHRIEGSERLLGAEVRGMHPLNDSVLLIGTDFKGVFAYDGMEISAFSTEALPYIYANQLYAFAVGQNHLAFGTVSGGVVITDRAGNNPLVLQQKNSALPNNTVLSLAFDRSGNLWAGLDQGLACIGLAASGYALQQTEYPIGSGYTSFVRQDTLYLGTNTGLYYVAQNQPFHLRLVTGSTGQVWRLKEIDGTLFCCHHRGLFEVKGTALRPLNTADGFWEVVPYDKRHLLAGSYNGFYRLEKRQGRWQSVRVLQGFDDPALNFAVDGKGRLWVVSTQGVERLVVGKDWKVRQDSLVCSFDPQHPFYHIDKLGNRLLVSAEQACFVVNQEGKVESGQSLADSLAGAHHYALVQQDAQGRIWYLTANRLAFLDTEGKRHFVLEDPNFFIGGFPSLTRVQEDEYIVGGVSGFYQICPSKVRPVEAVEVPRLALRRVTWVKEKDSVLYGESLMGSPVPSAKKLTLPYGQYYLRFAFGGMGLMPMGVQYATRLSPIEKDFIPLDNRAFRDFPALKDGHYHLEVRCSSPMSQPQVCLQFAFRILPPWYRSATAFTIYALLLVLMLGGLVWCVLYWDKRGKQRIAALKDQQLNEKQLTIARLQQQQAQDTLHHQQRELNNVLLTQVNRNTLIEDCQAGLQKIATYLQTKDEPKALAKVQSMLRKLNAEKNSAVDWERFEKNFDLVNDHFVQRLTTLYPWMSEQERQMCIYVYLGLMSKEMAPLLNMSVRSVETQRYRLRQKMGLPEGTNLKTYFTTL